VTDDGDVLARMRRGELGQNRRDAFLSIEE
jgi:hypothetical protein